MQLYNAHTVNKVFTADIAEAHAIGLSHRVPKLCKQVQDWHDLPWHVTTVVHVLQRLHLVRLWEGLEEHQASNLASRALFWSRIPSTMMAQRDNTSLHNRGVADL